MYSHYHNARIKQASTRFLLITKNQGAVMSMPSHLLQHQVKHRFAEFIQSYDDTELFWHEGTRENDTSLTIRYPIADGFAGASGRFVTGFWPRFEVSTPEEQANVLDRIFWRIEAIQGTGTYLPNTTFGLDTFNSDQTDKS
ncbi:hypothetical protein [Andreprevotia sp. IGB-42]|uniref:hypothetical protein n=1 Tax=Andreprevotia sp. IGB-42 TaxID=2497473 RepID=UPI001358FA4F|nr:hypothetical protein [Andreprevotia sp. IGB-42]